MERLKLGFIGAGFVAKFHALALKMVRGIDLVGITKRSTSDLKTQRVLRLSCL